MTSLKWLIYCYLLIVFCASTAKANNDWHKLTAKQQTTQNQQLQAQDAQAQTLQTQKQSPAPLTNHSVVHLGVDGVFDSNGNPLAISPANQALHYQASEAMVDVHSKTKQKSAPKTAAKNTKKTSAKGKDYTERGRVANDPSCRWLNARIIALEKSNRSTSYRKQYIKDELAVRQSEFSCLRCGADGPSQGDHSQCQYKR